MRVGEDELRRQDDTQIQPPQGRRHTVDLPQVLNNLSIQAFEHIL